MNRYSYALVICLSTALGAGVAHGKECEGVSFSEQVQSEGGTLMLNGLACARRRS